MPFAPQLRKVFSNGVNPEVNKLYSTSLPAFVGPIKEALTLNTES